MGYFRELPNLRYPSFLSEKTSSLDFIEVKNIAKSIFKTVNFFKPESSRKESKETYLHCEGLKSL